MSLPVIDFFVAGKPYAKQSARFTRTGRSYQTENVKAWQNTIRIRAMEVWHRDPINIPIRVALHFFVWRDRADVDNLAKAVLDGLQGVIYVNDLKVQILIVAKERSKDIHGVRIVIDEYAK